MLMLVIKFLSVFFDHVLDGRTLSDNMLTGSLPVELKKLNNLTELYVLSLEKRRCYLCSFL